LFLASIVGPKEGVRKVRSKERETAQARGGGEGQKRGDTLDLTDSCKSLEVR